MTDTSTATDFEALAAAQLPEWAIGHAKGYMDEGALLPTRDGRRMGNAIVAKMETRDYGPVAKVVTDAGNVCHMTERELEECFFPPKWISNVETHPGVHWAKQKNPGLL